jgi:hypothetical protein
MDVTSVQYCTGVVNGDQPSDVFASWPEAGITGGRTGRLRTPAQSSPLSSLRALVRAHRLRQDSSTTHKVRSFTS